MEEALARIGFEVTIVPQFEGLHTAGYRFDVLALKK
jgi:hypothetical protein